MESLGIPEIIHTIPPKNARLIKIVSASLVSVLVLLGGVWVIVPKVLKSSADKLASQGRHVDAAEKLKLACAFMPMDRAGYQMQMGQELRLAKNYPAAKQAFEQVLKKNPNDVGALKELGMVLSESGQKDAALASFQKYLDIKQDDAEVLKWVAEIAYDSKDYASASVAYDKFVKTGQAGAEDWKRLGISYFENKDSGRAAEALKKALERQADLKEVHGYLGKIHMEQKKYDLAMSELKLELASSPDNAELKDIYADSVQKSADMFISERKFEDAIAVLKEGLSISTKSDAAFHYELANLYALRRKRGDAMSHLVQAVKSDPALKAKAKKDSAFALYRKSPAFQKAVR